MRPRASCVGRRERPNPEPWWRKLWRVENPTRAPTGGLSLARRRGRRGTDSRGEQSFEAGVPAANRRAQCRWERDDTCGAPSARRGDRPSDRRDLRPGSCVPGPPSGGFDRAKSRLEQVKAIVNLPQALRRRQSNANPQGSKRPARAGTAPREGKALEGRSRDASGMEQGREASGTTTNGEAQKASSESRVSRNRREGQEP